MKLLQDGRIQCRVRITGTYHGKPFVYVDPEDSDGSQYIWPVSDECASDYERASGFWWDEGNYGCDCNRCRFVGAKLDCGGTIRIDRIEPLEPGLPVLVLNESGDKQ